MVDPVCIMWYAYRCGTHTDYLGEYTEGLEHFRFIMYYTSRVRHWNMLIVLFLTGKCTEGIFAKHEV